MAAPITLDGDAGGGQILRNGFSLAALAQRPIHVTNIRGARNPPGLRPQHLQGIEVVRAMCGGRLDGARQGSCAVTFWPAAFTAGEFVADTGTAGSCTLLAQIALPCLPFAAGPSVLVARGGTDVNFSPPCDELLFVLLPLLRRFGLQYSVDLVRRGFFPRGGGELRIRAQQLGSGGGLQPVTMLDPGRVVRVEGRAFATGGREAQELPLMVATATAALQASLPGVAVAVEQVVESPQTASGTGSSITLVAVTDTDCRLGATVFRDPKQRLGPQQCGQQAAETLLGQLHDGGCVDRFMQDQLVIFMALAAGRSAIRIGPVSDHTALAITTAEALLPCKFHVQPDGPTNVLTCEGAGLTAPGCYAGGPAAASPPSRPLPAPNSDGSPAQAPAQTPAPTAAIAATAPTAAPTVAPTAPTVAPAAAPTTAAQKAAASSIADRWAAAYGGGNAAGAQTPGDGGQGGKGKGKGKGHGRSGPYY